MIKSHNHRYDVCIVGGLGRVGLPLGLSLADVGQQVVLYDINQTTKEIVASGKMPFLEAGAEPVLQRVLHQTLHLSDNKQVISDSYFVILVIGTPIDEHLNPKFTLFKKLLEELTEVISDDQHIILRSTVFPGTTENIKRLLEARGKQTKLSFCPERIAQGKAMEELRTLPQIVSAFDSETLEEAKQLFTPLTQDVLFLTPIEAEVAKLFTNTWRYIQFAIANYFYQITTQNDLDFYKIYNAITYNYPRAEHFPSAGFAAGPCLHKDTMQLAAYSNNSFFLGHAAMLVNEGLPNFIVQRLKERYNLRDKVVGILGMAFKAGNDDKRDSLSYKLKKLLEIEAQQVLCTDSYLQEEGFVTPDKLIAHADIVILGTPHQDYAELQIPDDKPLVDVWNFYGKGGLF